MLAGCLAALLGAGLAEVPVSHRKLVSVDGQALALYRYGVPNASRPPVLLVPELGMSRQAYDCESEGLARFLAAHGLEAYVAELRGQGNAGVPAGGYRLRDLERDVVAAALAIDSPSVDLVAHGWSGTLSLAAAAGPQLAGRVRRTIALSTPAAPDVPSPLVERLLERGGHLRALATDSELARAFALVFALGGRFKRGRLEQLRASAFSDLGPVASADLLWWMRSGDLALSDGSTVARRLGRYRVPTLLFLGLADGFASPELASPLREVVAGPVALKSFTRFELVGEDYSHLSMLHGEFAKNDIFAPALEFLSR